MPGLFRPNGLLFLNATPAPLWATRPGILFWPELTVLLALVIATVYAAFGTAGFFDTYRDLFVATEIAQGVHFPLAGPPIYSTLHLGPIWFYLLAIPQKFFGISGAIAFIALLAALKYPLAMRLGWQLGGRSGAWVLLGATLAFGWSVFEPMWLNHANVVETAMFALALSLRAHWQAPSLRRIFWVGLFAALCLHAHPTTLLLAIGTVLAAIWHFRARVLSAVLIALIAGLLPFLPYFVDQALSGFGDVAAVSGYLAKTTAVNAPLLPRVVPLIQASVFGGFESAGRMLLWRVNGSFFAAWFVLGIGLFGALYAINGPRRNWLLGCVAGLVLQCIFLVLVRPETPFWMIWSCSPPIIAFFSLAAWPAAIESKTRKTLRSLSIATLLIFQLACLISLGQMREEVRTPKFAAGQRGLMDVAERTRAVEIVVVGRHYFQHLEALGKLLCAPIAARGHLALFTERTLFVGVQNACGNLGPAILGGAPTRPSRALLAKSALRPLGWHTALPQAGLYEVSVTGVLSQGPGLTPLAQHRQNQRLGSGTQAIEMHAVLPAGSALAIFQYMETVLPLDVQRVTCNGTERTAVFKEQNVQIFAPCHAAAARWQIDVRGTLEAVDAFGFSPLRK